MYMLGLDRFKRGKKKNLPAATGQAQLIKIDYDAIIAQAEEKNNAVDQIKN